MAFDTANKLRSAASFPVITVYPVADETLTGADLRHAAWLYVGALDFDHTASDAGTASDSAGIALTASDAIIFSEVGIITAEIVAQDSVQSAESLQTVFDFIAVDVASLIDSAVVGITASDLASLSDGTDLEQTELLAGARLLPPQRSGFPRRVVSTFPRDPLKPAFQRSSRKPPFPR